MARLTASHHAPTIVRPVIGLREEEAQRSPPSSDLTFPEFRRIESTMLRFRQGFAGFACLLFALIVALPVLAYASPPDPSWGHGVYDDADFDDIVCLIIASSGLAEDLCAASRSPHFTLTDAELPQNESSIASSSLTSPQPRAPPASCSLPFASP
jgi:hypothetical protein